MKKLFIVLLGLYVTVVSSAEVNCNDPISTLEVNVCAGIELEHAQQEMNHYLLKSKLHLSYDAQLVTAIDKAQKAWLNYSEAHCDAIYTKWRDGSIRGVMSLNCKIALTEQRTHQIWSNFLTYMDSTEPVLPEPKLR